jgi:hypothetical protein
MPHGDGRQARKTEHDLLELLVVAVNAVPVGTDSFVEIVLWARESSPMCSLFRAVE